MTSYSTIIAAGSDPLYYYSKSALSVSEDGGETWQKITHVPFDVHEHVQVLEGDSQGWIAVSNTGRAAWASDANRLDQWHPAYVFDEPPWQILDISYSGITNSWLGVGYVKTPSTLAESAVIVQTTQAVDAVSWNRRYVHPDPHSGLWDIQVDHVSGECVAVGYKQGDQPLLVWSSDGGISWAEIALPDHIQTPLFSVSGTLNNLYLGGRGVIFQGSVHTGFTASDVLRNHMQKPVSITFIQNSFDPNQPIQTLAWGGSGVFYSVNGSDYDSILVPGYTFSAGVYTGSQWILGCHSLLNQYTGFKTVLKQDPDVRLELQGYHNQVHARKLLAR